MKALILDNNVIDILETEFEVHESMSWVDCDDTIKVGYTYSNGNFIAPQEAEALTYAQLRASEYPNIGDQLDMIFRAGLGGDEFQAAIQAVKDKYPKE